MPVRMFVTKCILNCIQLVRDLPIVGGDGRKVGYYTGIIVSLSTTSATQDATIRIIDFSPLCRGGSDHISLEPSF